MKGSQFDELAFFRAIADSGVRALLIGRRALVALGMPVMTADYDFWIAADEAERFNDALRPFDMIPNRAPDQARQVGRYVLENGERVDVLVARGVSTVAGVMVEFEEIWPRRNSVEIGPGVTVAVPAIDDLIATKRFAARPRDADDIRWLEKLRGTS